MRTSRPTRDLKLFLPVASLCAGALLLGRLPKQQGLAGHQKLMRTDWRNYQPARLSTQTTQQSHPHSVHDESAAAVPIRYRGYSSNPDLLDLVEVDLVRGAVVELGRLGRFVVGDLLGVLQGAAAFEVGGEAGPTKGVAANLLG